MNTFILMGVSGTGKTTLGLALAAATGGDFFDGDDYHPEANRKKMAAGNPLTDEDRQGWLYSIAGLIAARSGSEKPTFIACSALKESYREILQMPAADLQFLFLRASEELLLQRLKKRATTSDHFMPLSLLQSQIADLEIPEDATVLDVSKSVETLVSEFLQDRDLGSAKA